MAFNVTNAIRRYFNTATIYGIATGAASSLSKVMFDNSQHIYDQAQRAGVEIAGYTGLATAVVTGIYAGYNAFCGVRLKRHNNII